jgi:hypothetical protein
MPEMTSVQRSPQPAIGGYPMASPRPLQTQRGLNGFPEYLKNTESMGENSYKLSSANTLFHAVLKVSRAFMKSDSINIAISNSVTVSIKFSQIIICLLVN